MDDDESAELDQVGSTVSLPGKPLEGCSDEEAGAVGWMVVSGNPREGASSKGACCELTGASSTTELDVSAPKSYTSLLEESVEDETGELLGVHCEDVVAEFEGLDSENVGCMGFSGISPVDATLEVGSEYSEEVVSSLSHQGRSLEDAPWLSSFTAFELSATLLDELVQGTELDATEEVGCADVVRVLVIVTVCASLNPSNVGSMVVVYSLWPGVDQGSSALKLERKGAQSK